MLAPLIGMLSPTGARARLSILLFHRVQAELDPLFPSERPAAAFDALCGDLKRWFRVLPLDEALSLQREGRLPARAAAITFDDGYRDNHDVALPILRRHGLHASFFVATGFLDGGRMWNDTVVEVLRRHPGPGLDLAGTTLAALGPLNLSDWPARRQALGRLLEHIKYLDFDARQQAVDALAAASGLSLPTDLMMDSKQVLALHRAGMEIGGHTVQHPILACLPAAQAEHEIARGKQQLESLLGAPVRLFAYPNGRPGKDYRIEHARMVQAAGFGAAVTTAAGAARAEDDPYQIPRFTPWDAQNWRFGLRLAQNLRRTGARA